MNPLNDPMSSAPSPRPPGEPVAPIAPALLQMHVARPAVTRVSRKALLVVALLGGALTLIVLVVGLGDHRSARKSAAADENSLRPNGPIESIKDLPQDYSFDVDKLVSSYEQPVRLLAPATLPARGQDPQLAQALRDLAEQRRKLLEQQWKEQQAALDSPLTFGAVKSTSNRSSAAAITAPATTMPTLVMLGPDNHAAMGGVNNSGNGHGDVSGINGSAEGILQNHQQDKELFLTQASAVEPYLSKPLLNPASNYELKAGSMIPAALLTAINTDLPGQIIAQVTENVYDSATGNYLLIPQGSRLLGKYQSLVTNGQNRSLLIWQRLIYPNGNSIVLDAMPGTDESGTAGVADKVDYHTAKLAQAVALTTALAYGGNLARDPKSTSSYGNSDVVGDSVAQEANRIGEKIIDRQLDVQPTITIRQGWPLRVLVNKDIVLAPYAP